MWQPVIYLTFMKKNDALAIINDATAHGFEFKVENGVIYAREQKTILDC